MLISNLNGILFLWVVLVLMACSGGDGLRLYGVIEMGGSINYESKLELHEVTLPPLATDNGQDFRANLEFQAHHILSAINADGAYRRGYFGQGTNIAIVEQGFDINHPDLELNIDARDENLVSGNSFSERLIDFDSDIEEASDNIHGTFVSILAAGARGNDGGGAVFFEGEVESLVRLKDSHGVAPMATIIPIQNRDSGVLGTVEAFRRASTSDAHIVNNSFGSSLPYLWAKRRGVDNEYLPGDWLLNNPLPIFLPIFSGNSYEFFVSQFIEISNLIEEKDIVFVWSSGNGSWHSGASIDICGKNYRDESGCELSQSLDGGSEVAQIDFINEFDIFDDDGDFVFSFADIWGEDIDNIDYNDPGGWVNAPIFEPKLIGKWLAVGSVDINNEISSFSNGCGTAKNWCLVAPGERIELLADNRAISGTSFSTPIASGALAVLRSRMPEMPMEVVLAVLLTSATPLGTRVLTGNPDDVYGWGMLNLENAINMQGEVTLLRVVPNTSSNIQNSPVQQLGDDGSITFPAHLLHLQQKLQTMEVAVEGVGDVYFNMPLGGIVSIDSATTSTFGDTVADMLLLESSKNPNTGVLFASVDIATQKLKSAGVNLGIFQLRHDFCGDCKKSVWWEWENLDHAVTTPFFVQNSNAIVLSMPGFGIRPFLSAGLGGDSQFHQLGLRWEQSYASLGVVVEISEIYEKNSFLGANLGSLGQARTTTRLVSFGLHHTYGDWKGFVRYEHAYSETDVAKGGLLNAVSDLLSEGWAAGIEHKNLLTRGDQLRFITSRNGVIEGQAHFQINTVEGSFINAFYNGKIQTIGVNTTTVDIAGGGKTHLALGYMIPFAINTRLALGIEHNIEDHVSVFSARFNIDL